MSVIKVLGAQAKAERLARIQGSKIYRDGAFHNVLPTPMGLERATFWQTLKTFAATRSQASPPKRLEAVKTDLHILDAALPSVVWFGHSSYLLKHMGKVILVDPVFSRYASPIPVLIKGFLGTEIYAAADMPEIDLLIITHDHYDHLDYPTMLALKSKIKRVVTSLGVGAHLEMWGFAKDMITELDWFESAEPFDGLKVTATPARHFSGRGFSKNQSLWSSFVLSWASLKFFVGGDSGYSHHFKEIGDAYGPFDLAFIECGQYSPSWPHIHAVPEQSVQASVDLAAKMMMPVHWAKFPLAFHSWNEPVRRARAEALNLGVTITTPRIGEVQVVGGSPHQQAWWEL